MDKSWMMENRMSREYDVGVESFIQFGLSHAKGSNLIRCPCLKCENRLLKDDELVATQKTTNVFGEEDILTRALGGKDRPRIVRGVGKYVTKKKYFHTATKPKTNGKENEKATSKEHDRMAKRIKELKDELFKMKEKDDYLGKLKEEPGIGCKEKSSMQGTENMNDFEDLSNDLESQKDVEDDVELNEEIKVNIAKDDEQVEDVTLEKMKKVTDGVCAIPIPSKQEMYKMSQEVGSHILWSQHLVITDNVKMDYRKFTKDMITFAPIPIQSAPVALRFLLRMVEHMGSAIQITTPYDVFGVQRKCCIMIESLKDFSSMRPIATASLDAYIMSSHLYVYPQCPKQSGVVECGYYVMRFMWDIILSVSTSIIDIMKDSPRTYTRDDINCIRSEWAEFVGKHVYCA
ncbi:36.4 kDa proline-rich protein-like [Cucumis melo var. makuwa]|uniref:36.4 kDa proline-rich protein-like n=1 Tax=Cucumis melo var. makuwa TaxID=1194695 RepID=A0A5D3BT32_CUCMM|nr:36.4 kDa proline-rich protein-like [Cucumis melo var. makuwa]TYK02280.1 36.4 kDa proline-rich protein-like [Cucumis melo var. makuwa]